MRTPLLALAAAAAVTVTGLTATAAAQSTVHPPQARAAASAGRASSAKTVTGPHMYDPATGKPFPDASTVTVSRTANLVNQMLHVSWTNFTPSSSLVYNPSNVAYPVMVAECKGTEPTSPADCYGAENGGVTSTSGADGPMNDAYATTASNGTGQTDIDILTKVENQYLGCEQGHPCSLAIVPSQGGNYSVTPPDCADHSHDFTFGTGYAVGAEAFGSEDYSCSWAERIVVPLTFARTAASCPRRKAAFTAAGSPMLERAMGSWLVALCEGSHGTNIVYDSSISEPLSLADLGTGRVDVALTTRTARAQGISTGPKHYVYAPVAVSATSIAYWFDNPVTGLPQTGVRLDQRLVLKLLTQSYNFERIACPPRIPKTPCDKGVKHDALDLFADPEFTSLNPRILQPVDSGIEVPTVGSGESDNTWTVTRWIGANRAADRFLAGRPEPDGEHINLSYLGLQYPTDAFIGQDAFPLIAHEYNPVFPFSLVATDQVENWPPSTEDYKDPVTGNYDRLPPQIPGQRALIAITGEGDAAADLFPTAALHNGAGAYARPTSAGMAAAVKTMIPAGDGTLQVNEHSANPAVYPLTMVIYAVAPTSGTSHAKAAAIARFIDYAAGVGQTPGARAGQLPPGYLPLTATLRAQARKAAQEVLHQSGGGAPRH